MPPSREPNPLSFVTVPPYELRDRVAPVYATIAQQICEAIASGVLAPGTRLPPLRDFAESLNVVKGTVGQAYSLLTDDGLIEGDTGGKFVSGDSRVRHRAAILYARVETSTFLARLKMLGLERTDVEQICKTVIGMLYNKRQTDTDGRPLPRGDEPAPKPAGTRKKR